MVNRKGLNAYSNQSATQSHKERANSHEDLNYYQSLAKVCARAIADAPEQAFASCRTAQRERKEPEEFAAVREEFRRRVGALAAKYVALLEEDLNSPSAQERLAATIEFYSRSESLVTRFESLVVSLT